MEGAVGNPAFSLQDDFQILPLDDALGLGDVVIDRVEVADFPDRQILGQLPGPGR